MGSRCFLLSALPLLLATPAFAQQENGTEPVFNLPREKPQTSPDKQGPELDVFRGAPATVTPPPVVTPTIQLPPPVNTAPQPAPRSQPQRPATPPQAETRPTPQPAAQPTTQPTPARPPANQTAPASTMPASGETAPLPSPGGNQSLPPAGNSATPAPLEAPVPVAEPAFPWPWVAAAAAVIALIGAFLWLRRRKPEEREESFHQPEPAPPPPVPPQPVPPPSAPRPVQPKAVPPPPPAPTKPQAEPDTADRPWLDLAMEIQAARLTLMGATIGYTLTLHNRGTHAAQDILVRSLIANADAQQQSLFQQFFAGETGLPVHSIVSIAPGETQKLSGEMRLDAQEIAAIRMGQRALLIPVIAFDAQYRWANEAGETQGAGRTGRAFIVGEEQTPPVERLSPFRLDLGPRQYPTPGSRATALSLAS
ncbi:hypothetical protein CAF53_08690 [Sphingobium sp. LB126]|uniref:hypothetical protein n=1 Tax=Sphingobium sp. LB126 TaxID=1983755 RepID=UPI000C204F67|nr:hypothetical protein [Sphingobium sp. LB126]PJG48309.1 hypothetical protein CAF53_08690 [Sphingobium sp. LB126]